MVKKVSIYIIAYTQYRRVTDGRTDGRTSCHGIVRAMHTRRAVKICSRVDPTGSAILRKPGDGRAATASACAVCRLCKTIFPLVGPIYQALKQCQSNVNSK